MKGNGDDGLMDKQRWCRAEFEYLSWSVDGLLNLMLIEGINLGNQGVNSGWKRQVGSGEVLVMRRI
ncbi:unnamed protein product [Rhodiola kirilowii]